VTSYYTNSVACIGTSQSFSIVVNPTPTVTDPSDQVVCNGSNVSAVTFSGIATSFNWLNNTPTIGLPSSGTGNINSFTALNNGNNPVVALITVTPHFGACIGDDEVFSITVNPNPNFIAFNNEPIICSGSSTDISFTSSTTGHQINVVSVTYNGAGSSGTIIPGTTTFLNGGTLSEALTNTSNSPIDVVYVFNVTTPGTSPICPIAPINQTLTVRVLPSPAFSIANGAAVICSGGNVNITLNTPVANGQIRLVSVNYGPVIGSLAPGALFIDGQKVTESLVNSTNAPFTVTYTFEALVGSCAPSGQQSVDVVVDPSPSLGLNNTVFTICNTETPTISLNNPNLVSGTAYVWTVLSSNVSGATDQLVPQLASAINVPLSLTVLSNPGSVVYSIRAVANNCYSAPQTVTVNVSPVPTATSADAIICSGQTASIPIVSSPNNVLGTTYIWTTSPSPNVIGASDGDGSLITQTLSLNDFTTGTVVYSITPWANNCKGTEDITTVTINPIATVMAEPDKDVCEPTSFVVTGVIGGAATSGTWTVLGTFFGSISSSTTSSGTVTATYSIGPNDIDKTIQFKLETNDPDNITGPCSTASDFLNVAVRRKPTVTLPPDETICERASIDLVGTIGGGATDAEWSIVSGAGNLSATSITGLTVTAKYDLNIAADVSNVVTMRLEAQNPPPSCAVAFDEINFTINQKAVVSASPNLAQCENDLFIDLDGVIGGSTVATLWSGGLGTFDDPSVPTTKYRYAPSELNTTVTLTLTAIDPDGIGSNGPCQAESIITLLKINPLPSVLFFGLDIGIGNPRDINLAPSIAENADPFSIFGTKSGGTFSISPGSGLSNPRLEDQLDVVDFDPQAAVLYDGTPTTINRITYTFTDASNCTNSSTQYIKVNAETEADFRVEGAKSGIDVDYEICGELGDVRLIGIPPVSTGLSGTFFSSVSLGSRIIQIGSEFFINTNNLEDKVYLIRYDYVNQQNVPSFKTKNLRILPTPVAQIAAPSNNCIDKEVQFNDVSTLQSIIANRSWSFGDGNVASTKNPRNDYTIAGPGSYDVTLLIESNGGCTSDTTITIRVGKVPKVDFDWESICNNDDTEFKDQTTDLGTSAIEQYQWEFGDGDIITFPASTPSIPNGTNSGRTSGTPKDPLHKYSVSGSYGVKLNVLTDDGCSAEVFNRIFILQLEVIKATQGEEYNENFDGTPRGGWNQELISTDTSWIWGIPTGNKMTPISGNAWFTGGNDDPARSTSYWPNEESALHWPCFDISSLKRPMVSFDYWLDTQSGVDGVVMEYSANGREWKSIGEKDKGINWYDPRIFVSTSNGSRAVGWNGTSNEKWLSGRFNLDTIPEDKRGKVRLRLKFASDNSTPSGSYFDGFAIDNIFLGEKSRNVIVEHFTNASNTTASTANSYLDGLLANERSKRTYDSTDFRIIQYHLNYGGTPDPMFADNPEHQDSRSFSFGNTRTPFTVMDGRLGTFDTETFTGINYKEVKPASIDRRALSSPEFSIALDTLQTTADSINLIMNIKANIAYPDPVVVQAVLIDDGFPNFRNVFRKGFLGLEGRTISDWDINETLVINAKTSINVPLSRPDSLSVIAYVFDKKTKVFLQSAYLKINSKRVTLVTGTEDEAYGVSVYPNPSSGRTNLKVGGIFKPGNWQLVDQRGVSVLKGELVNTPVGYNEIDVSKLANGLYILKVDVKGSKSIYKKLVVANMN
jgi:PKD domain/Secretion system C-terminal sorting domain/PKD-like domain